MTITDWITAISAAFTTLLTFALVIAAFVAWKTAKHTLEESRKASQAAIDSAKAAIAANEQARLDSIEQTRPYVFAELVPSLAGPGCFDIRIVNVGKSSARGLRFECDPYPREPDDIAQSVIELLGKPRTLPPGSSMRLYWRLTASDGAYLNGGSTEHGMPGEATLVRVSYTDGSVPGRAYEDEFWMVPDDVGSAPAPEGGPNGDNVPEDLKQFYKLGQVLVRRVGEITR
ncbi:MAG: hypothetical protein LBL55_08210 [Propionibacteriaceae bacterium]|jgi:hypothetical protein|nr:hypothetical protein [Propionibacteriaceae bacterium]